MPAIDVLHPETQAVLIPAGTMLDEDVLDIWKLLASTKSRSVPADLRHPLRSVRQCYGRDLGRGGW